MLSRRPKTNVRPMTNERITSKLNNLIGSPEFKGVYDQDSLPTFGGRIPTYPWAIVANTLSDRSTKVGHWVVFCLIKKVKVTTLTRWERNQKQHIGDGI
jgi:hypothetical protein